MTDTQTRTDLRRVLARASSPDERLAGSWLEPDPEAPNQAAALVEAWRAAVSSEAGEDRWLQGVLGLSDADLHTMLGPVRVRDGAPLPAWALVIERALAEGDIPASEPGAHVLELFVRMAQRDLAEIVAAAGLEISLAGTHGLLNMLAVRLGRVVGPALEYEQTLLNNLPLWLRASDGEQPVLDGTHEGWRQRLETLPGLAQVIGVAYTHWHVFVAEICQRTVHDRALLGRIFMQGRDPGELVEVTGDTGDVHNEGRAVAILRFASGERVVYKPKDLTVAAAWMDLVRDLNSADSGVSIPPRIIEVRGDYTWEAFVVPQPCGSDDEVARFYQRMGQTIRLLQLLEARDFWLDNLIASGDAPHFIDMEMLLQPRIALPGTLSAAEHEGFAWIEESASRTSAICMPTPIASGVPSAELGALGAAGPFASPFRFELTALTGAADPPPLSPEGYVLWEHPEHVPVLHDEPHPADAYLDHVLAGYAAMQEALCAQQHTLLRSGGPLARMATAPIRHIVRDTWSCLKLVNHSVKPALLTDGVQRELFLAQLYRPVVGNQDRTASDIRIIAAEIRDLRQLDVPFFLCTAVGDRVYTVDHSLDEPYFPEPAWTRLQRRVAALTAFPLDEHLALVRSSFAVGRPLGSPRAVPTAVYLREQCHSPASYLPVAADIASTVLAHSFGQGEAWGGITYHPLADMPGLEVLRPDILTGTTGLAMVFADLFAATGDAHWQAAASRALEPSVRSMRSEVDRFGRGLPALASAGTHYGYGAWLRGFDRVGAVEESALLRAEATSAHAMLAARLREPITDGDVMMNGAGLVLTCLHLVPEVLDEALVADITPALVKALAQPDHRRPGWADHALRSLPGPRAGAALTLHRLHAADDAVQQWAQSTLDLGHAPDMRAGTLLALNEITRGTGLGTASRMLTHRCLSHWLDSGDTWRLLDVIELALQGNTPDLGERAAQRLLAIHQRTGSWFGAAYANDRHNLSATWGVMAVAHALLRLGTDVRVPSLRLVGGSGSSATRHAEG